MSSFSRMAVAAALALLAAPLSAQIPSNIQVGQRLRITDINGRGTIGVLMLTTDAGTILLRPSTLDAQVDSIPAGEVERIEISGGWEHHVLHDMLVTMAVSGSALGILYGETWGGKCDWLTCSQGDALRIGAAAGAILGIPLGLLVAMIRSKEVWEEARTIHLPSPKPAVRFAFTRGGGDSVAVLVPLTER